MVAIAHNKGVIKCHQYFGSINSETCKSFIEKQFSDMFKNSANSKGKLFLQDGQLSQNSKIACEAIDFARYSLFNIPPRSPDLNPIENMFHLIGKQLKKYDIAVHKTWNMKLMKNLVGVLKTQF